MFQYLIVVLVTTGTVNADEKRLLLTDPDVVAQRLSQLESTVHQLSSTVHQLVLLRYNQPRYNSYRSIRRPKKVKSSFCIDTAGSTYVRWGRKSCPNNTELVYSGYVGGGLFDSFGSAADYVCLTHETVLGIHKPNSYSFMYGGEYQAYNDAVFEQDAPCSVCLNKNAHSSIMIPGRNACYHGWNLEYRGVLVSGYYGHKAASTYIFLDEIPEIVDGGAADQDGKLLYTVVGKCGSLKCPPYKNDYEITCAVCSK